MKQLNFSVATLALLPFYISPSTANTEAKIEACKTETIITAADVTTSAGSSYRVETYYRAPLETSARFITEQPALMTVEGEFVWIESARGPAMGGENEQRFVIGHQFHALALSFDEIMTDIETADDIVFGGNVYHGRIGSYPLGGGAALVLDKSEKPLGLIMSLPGETSIEVTYEDWRKTASGRMAPYAVTITHNGKVYSYKYSDITFGMGGRKEFHDRYPAPPLDDITKLRAAQDECSEN